MADSIRLAVLKEISNAIAAEVTPANGYEFDLTGKVRRGKLRLTQDTVMPLVSILESPNPDLNVERPGGSAGGADEQRDQWIVFLQGWVEDDFDNPTDPAHQLMASVKKSLAKLRDDLVAGKYRDRPPGAQSALCAVTNLEIDPGVVRPPNELSEKAFFWMHLIIGIVEPLDDPFFTP